MKNKKDSTLKYGGYASVMTGLVVIIAIVANMVVGQFNMKFDLTKNKLYTLSEDTVSLLEGLDQEITIYSIYPEESQISVVTEILDKYASYSVFIKSENVDPYKNPQFAAKYAGSGEVVTVGSVVVETAEGYKIIPQEQLADVYTNQETGETYMQGIKLESVLTGAIRNITSGETLTVYTLAGHGEYELYDDFIKELEYGGYSHEELNLITGGVIPEDCEILVINAPAEDITSDELKAINEYLDNGGSLLVTLGITASDMSNFNSLLSNYGVASSQRLVIEGSADHVYQTNPYYLIPSLSSQSIISSKLVESSTNSFMPFALNIELLDTKRTTVNIEPFMSTSEYAYSKNFVELESSEKTDADPTGPFVLGASITDIDASGEEDGVKIVLFSATTILESEMNSVVNGGNYGLVMNSVDWLSDNETALRSKSLGADDYLQITQSKAIVVMILSVIVIPLIILVIGLVVTLRRKNK